MLTLVSKHLTALGSEDIIYTLCATPLVLRYKKAIDAGDIKELGADTLELLKLCEDEVLDKN